MCARLKIRNFQQEKLRRNKHEEQLKCEKTESHCMRKLMIIATLFIEIGWERKKSRN